MYSESRLDDIDKATEWWGSLSKADRAEWFARVGTTRPADAWDAFKRARRRGDSMEPELQLTEDLRRGMEWWKSLSEEERADWFEKLGTHRPKDAWNAFKRAHGYVDGDTN